MIGMFYRPFDRMWLLESTKISARGTNIESDPHMCMHEGMWNVSLQTKKRGIKN